MKISSISQRTWVILGSVVTVLGIIGWWRYSVCFPSTDNAYVNANVANVSPQITGPVSVLNVQNHQAVKAGELLLVIDPQPFQVALDLAQAAYALANQQVASDAAAVETASSVVDQRYEEALNAEISGVRSLTLASKGVLPKQAADDAKMHMGDSKAALVGAKAQLRQAKAQLGEQGRANARLLQAKATVEQAELSLRYTRVYAPSDGVVENLTLRTGDVVTAATPMFAIIDKSQWWVDANFKETQLERIKPGQSVEIKLDMYSGDVFHGQVESISEGSGSTFSLLPPENATGNWVKVTQRFPVRIRILTDPSQDPLRVGASAAVSVNTLAKS